jgi:hypothetical protein
MDSFLTQKMENERLQRVLRDLKSGNLAANTTRASSSTLHSSDYGQGQGQTQPGSSAASSGWGGGMDAPGMSSMSGNGMSYGQSQYGHPQSSMHVNTQYYSTHQQYGMPSSIPGPSSHAGGGYGMYHSNTPQPLDLSRNYYGHGHGGMGDYGAQPSSASSSSTVYMPLQSPSMPSPLDEFDEGTRRKKVSILCLPVGTVLNQIRSTRGETLAINMSVLHVVGQIRQSGGRLVSLRFMLISFSA